ncbi:ATP-dependent zinc metallopeptidase - cell division protein [Gloeocapsa sp. PCC 7428]|nr:ATP-dependent zinc metallopeptidase - cell division protein [Gloeocapsa sp. PCC 7428]
MKQYEIIIKRKMLLINNYRLNEHPEKIRLIEQNLGEILKPTIDAYLHQSAANKSC